MLNTSFSPWPCYTQEEAEAVKRVLLSNRVNYWTGNECREFEKEFADWSGSKYAVALANGTLALDLALKVLGIGPGDDVIVTPRTYIASVSCVVNAGANPVFADVDVDSGNLSAIGIEQALTSRTRAVICVHLAGLPCDMDPIMDLAQKYGFKVIEDCAQAHGARYKGRGVGSIGHVGAWSFCQDKIMSTGGEGGMVTTNDEDLWRFMWSYKDHGKSYEACFNRIHPPGFRWLHESFGTNWRMTELQAVIGRIQLRRMSAWTIQRQKNANMLSLALLPYSGPRGPIRISTKACSGCNLSNNACNEQTFPNHCVFANYKFYTYVRNENLVNGWSRDRIIEEINKEGVPCYQGSCSEVYLEKAFEGTAWRPTRPLKVARELGETSIMFLVHPSLKTDEMQKTCEVAAQVLNQASGGICTQVAHH